MKISELSRAAGVPIASIKFYIREGLLPGGQTVAKNQASYTQEHVERLRLIRLLRERLQMPVATLAQVFAGAAAGGGEAFVRDGLDAVVTRGKKPSAPTLDVAQSAAWSRLAPMLRQLGYSCGPELLPVREALQAMVVIEDAMQQELGAEALAPYLALVDGLAKHEIPDDWDPERTPEAALRYAVLGTVLFEPLILALRRVAHNERAGALERARHGHAVPQPAAASPTKRRHKK